jgi:hypothetical protein
MLVGKFLNYDFPDLSDLNDKRGRGGCFRAFRTDDI